MLQGKHFSLPVSGNSVMSLIYMKLEIWFVAADGQMVSQKCLVQEVLNEKKKKKSYNNDHMQ